MASQGNSDIHPAGEQPAFWHADEHAPDSCNHQGDRILVGNAGHYVELNCLCVLWTRALSRGITDVSVTVPSQTGWWWKSSFSFSLPQPILCVPSLAHSALLGAGCAPGAGQAPVLLRQTGAGGGHCLRRGEKRSQGQGPAQGSPEIHPRAVPEIPQETQENKHVDPWLLNPTPKP